MTSTMIVTGGAGFIGSNFVHLVLDETECRVVCLDKLTYAGHLESLEDVESHPRYQFIEADIADREAMQSVFRDLQPDYVVNFAAESHVDRSIEDPGAFIRTNIVGTHELLDASRAMLAASGERRGCDFRLLHVSTDEVYGSLGPAGLFHEETPYAPNSPYSASKAAADHLVRAYHETYALPVVMTNCSNNYGPYQFPEKLIPLMTLNALEAKPLPVYGDGGQVRDWLYVEDHCRGVLLALFEGEPGERYNIGGRNERTNLQVVNAICDLLEELRPPGESSAMRAAGKSSYRELLSFVDDRPGHDRRYAIDATKIEKELGWRARHDFDAGLRKTVAWYLHNADWCDAVQSKGYGRERLGLGRREE